MKRDLRVLHHLHKETGDQDFPFSPAPVLLCCVPLPAHHVLGRQVLLPYNIHTVRLTEKMEWMPSEG